MVNSRRNKHKKPLKLNYYTMKDDHILVELSNRGYMKLSHEDEPILKLYTFYSVREGYVRTTINGKKKSAHRIIMEPPAGYVVDHINGDGFDNRRENLRVVTPYQNSINRNVSRSSTGVLGLSEHTDGGYYGRVARRGVTYCTPLRKDIDDAAKILSDLREGLDGIEWEGKKTEGDKL